MQNLRDCACSEPSRIAQAGYPSRRARPAAQFALKVKVHTACLVLRRICSVVAEISSRCLFYVIAVKRGKRLWSGCSVGRVSGCLVSHINNLPEFDTMSYYGLV